MNVETQTETALRAEADAFVPATSDQVATTSEGADWRVEVRAWMAEMELRIEAAVWPEAGVRGRHMTMMLAARRSGGRQRRLGRLRRRSACWAVDEHRAPECYVGGEESTRRFATAMSARGVDIGTE